MDYDPIRVYRAEFVDTGLLSDGAWSDEDRSALADRLRRRPRSVAVRLVSSLDGWAMFQRFRLTGRSGHELEEVKWLTDVASVVDPDPWRNALCDELLRSGPTELKAALRRLARADGTAGQPAPTLTQLATALRLVGEP